MKILKIENIVSIFKFLDNFQHKPLLFARLFHSCLERGVYLAPSAYEAGFLSTAHEGRDIDQACAVLSDAIAGL